MTARDIVTSRIAEQARRFPDWLNVPLEVAGLEARDAALAVAIDHAVMRRWLTLVAVIESRLSRPWAEIEFRLQAPLLVGAAQLLLLERLPDHAVINESVEWAKRHIRPKAGGMVNAVLRKVAALRKEIVAAPQAANLEGADHAISARDELPLHDGRVWKLNEPVFDVRSAGRLAQQTSHPESLISHWTTTLGHDRACSVARHGLIHPPIIVQAVPDANGAGLRPHDEPGFFVFEGDRQALLAFLNDHPGAIVQDPTSAAAVIATADIVKAPRTIIDACAGMGTKTRQLAALHPHAQIIATDIAEQRTDILRQQFADNDRVRVIDHRQLMEHRGTADLLLIDVPCSNTGVLARRVEAKYRYSRQSLEAVVNLQKQIIADSLLLTNEAGRIVYSTCSIEPAENEQQAHWVTRWHPYRVVAERCQLPVGSPVDPPSVYRDGGYYAILERPGRAR